MLIDQKRRIHKKTQEEWYKRRRRRREKHTHLQEHQQHPEKKALALERSLGLCDLFLPISLSQRILMQVTRTSTLELHLVRYLLGLQDSLLSVFCQKPGFQTTLSHVNPLPITQIFKEEKNEISFETNTPTTHSPHISGFHPNKNQNLSSKPKIFSLSQMLV